MSKTWRIGILLAAGLVLLLVLGSQGGTRSWDVSNLEISPQPAVVTPISREEAGALKARLTQFPPDAVERALDTWEAEILAATGGATIYYQVVGPFGISGIEALSGELNTLLVVADGENPAIHAIEPPVTQVRSTKGDVQWTQMAVSGIIELDGSARLAATGYLAVTDGGPFGQERLSNTLYPTFVVSLE